ncbi:hypothetical protein KIP39_20115, partial [Xanthomonas campestris pv. campestris]|nr:hypothetical protein [Xanthomonas campestris pv. campestris]
RTGLRRRQWFWFLLPRQKELAPQARKLCVEAGIGVSGSGIRLKRRINFLARARRKSPLRMSEQPTRLTLINPAGTSSH